jgi:hypothetical protein
MSNVGEGAFLGSSGESATSSLMGVDMSLTSAERTDPAFLYGYPASNVTDSCTRHMCLRCLGVLRQPLQMVRL